MTTFDWSNPDVTAFLARCKEKSITRIEVEMIAKAKRFDLRAIALYWIGAYEGDYAFMIDLHRKWASGVVLSDRQLAAALNCLITEGKRHSYAQTMDSAQLPNFTPKITTICELAQCSLCGQEELCIKNANGAYVCQNVKFCIERQRGNAPRTSQAGSGATEAPNPASDYPQTAEARSEALEQVCPNGTYTIVLNEQGDYRTLRLIDCPDSFNKAPGTQIAQYLSGSDNEANYTGFAFVSGKTIGIWSKYKKAVAPKHGLLEIALRVLLTADKEQQIDYGQAYAIESGNCWRCGHKLTVPASLRRGLGPICADKLGVS